MGALALLPWGRIALVAAILAAGAAGGWTLNGWRLGSQIGPLKAEISRLQARTAILENANAQCASSVKTQNEAVKGILEGGKQREARAKKDAADARRQVAGLATDIATLRAQKAPADAACVAQSEAAAKVIADEIRGRK